jgi:hypothetical protein
VGMQHALNQSNGYQILVWRQLGGPNSRWIKLKRILKKYVVCELDPAAEGAVE